ncbi:MAG: U32 family peptidase [Lachnospiraceae bacterium]|nr:U32 family peptidase [Lachnospiraceae bacterium]
MTENLYPHRVELLAPAGSKEALIGAFSAGADAVYLGGQRFGARAYADNFSAEEIIESLAQAHVLKRKIYLTANVLTREDELADLVRFVKKLYEAGLDGVIVQDIGVLPALHDACPDLPLHASTQISVTSSEAVRYLRRLGVSRVVPARELSLREMEILRAEDAAAYDRPIEIEAFIHGAMCYSYSGRCLMSSFLGGRSGNRGRCAGTCRLPYRILDENRKPAGPDARKKEVYPLSMKDMCVLQILPELIDAGIDSFKIEGRMKKPVYAAGVTAIYRKYIDRYYAWAEAGRPTPWTVEEADLDRLKSLYIRTELGTGYYHAKNGRNLVTIGKPGYAGTDAALEEEIRKKYLGRLPSCAVTGKAVFRTGEAARMTAVLSGDISADVTGAVVQPASASPMTEEGLRSRLCRTGDSLFTFSSLEIEMDDNIFLPVSAVNALRREVLSQLQDKILQSADRQRHQKASGYAAASGFGAEERKDSPFRRELWALVSTREQMEAAAASACSCILVDGEFDPPAADSMFSRTSEDEKSIQKTQKSKKPDVKWKKPEQSGQKKQIVSGKIRYICVLPPVFRVNNRDRIRQDILTAPEKGYSGIMVRTLEELSLALQMDYRGEIIADASLYSWNGRSMAALAKDCGRIVCPLELNQSGTLEAVRAAQTILAGAGTDGTDEVMAKIVLPVYGRIPMMESAGCVRKTENLCSKKDGFWYLEDRRGMQLPVRCRCGICSNTIYNAVPLSLHQFVGRGLCGKAPVHLCMFTTEDARETRRILQFFSALPNTGKNNRSGRNEGEKRGAAQKKGPAAPFEQFTNGHYKTGAL